MKSSPQDRKQRSSEVPSRRSRIVGSRLRRKPGAAGTLRFAPLTRDTWDDLKRLFGPRGACGGCWCMWWRNEKKVFEARRGPGNQRALRALVGAGRPLGILAFAGSRPIGWCAVAPREDTPRLEVSRNLRRFDDVPVWSVTCLFVAREERRHGVSEQLLRAAAVFARSHGAHWLEGYPLEPKRRLADAFAWTGVASAFQRMGFVEAHRRSAVQPIIRLDLRRFHRRSTPEFRRGRPA